MLLTTIIVFLSFSLLYAIVIPEKHIEYLKILLLTHCGFTSILSGCLYADFDNNTGDYSSFFLYKLDINVLNFTISFGLDGISAVFFFFTTILVFSCLLFVWDDIKFKDYAIVLLSLELILLVIFSILNLFFFYVCFEATLIPMYLMIGVWGSRERKIRAVYLFFFYTLCGSLLTLIAILYIYSVTGSLDIEYLLTYQFSRIEECLLWLAFFLSFASKIPMFPFHIWLPEAHVEAPTIGSVLLAGILLKLGVYGFLRFSITLFPEASLYFSPLVYTLSLVGIIYASMSAIGQTDLKRIIAYSSIAHMNLVTLGIFSLNSLGIQGAIVQSISHGFVSGGMFFLIGIIYVRYHTRSIHYYGGLVHCMPIYAILFVLFTMANIALPGTSSFAGEFLLLVGIYKTNTFITFFASLGVILSGAYSLWLCNRIIFGNLKTNYTIKYLDLTFNEFSVMIFLTLFVILLGIYPSLITNITEFSVYSLLYNFDISKI
jgi:NADH-quinone oxidoreductase subunit M